MLTVAVTGGIGAGKSTVSRRLAALGAVLVDSDRLAREVVAPGTDGLRQVAAEFGPGVVTDDGELDRAAVARVVFADSEARRRLEAIIHPRVRDAFARACDAAGPDAIVVNDIPLVRTVPEAARFHLVVTVAADDDVRLRRLIARGHTEADARARIEAQLSDAERRPLTDAWLDNDADEAELDRAVDGLWHSRIRPMAENITARRCAARGPASALVDADPAWAWQAALLGARISAAAGGARCEHTGPTSVPGAAAPDVIDLRLTVSDRAAAAGLAGPLADAGFPRDTDAGFPRDTDAGLLRDEDGRNGFLHRNADPGRAVDVEVAVRES